MSFKHVLVFFTAAVVSLANAKTFVGSPFYSHAAHLGPAAAYAAAAAPFAAYRHPALGYAPLPAAAAAAPYHSAPILPAAVPAPVAAPLAAPAPAPAPAAYAEAPAAAPAPPHITSSQYHSQDEFGRVEYGYSNVNSAKQERRDAYGNVAGSYTYVDASGAPRHVSYVADELGFRLTAANNLPLPVADTPAVANARLAHFDALNKANLLH